jgi:hypothetical protein
VCWGGVFYGVNWNALSKHFLSNKTQEKFSKRVLWKRERVPQVQTTLDSSQKGFYGRERVPQVQTTLDSSFHDDSGLRSKVDGFIALVSYE